MSRRQKFIWYFLLISTISFLLASLIASNKAFAGYYSTDNAFTDDINTYIGDTGLAIGQSSYGTPTDVLMRVPSTTIASSTRQGIGAIASDGGCTTGTAVNITFYDYGAGSSSVPRATMSASAGASCVWRAATSTPLCTDGCDIRVQSTGGIAVQGQTSKLNAGVYFYYPVGTIVDATKQPYILISTIGTPKGGSSQVTVSTTSLLYPISANGLISNMNCINVSTGTNCTFAYASTTNLVTPQNLGFVLLWFVCGWVIGFGIIVLFSKRYR